MKDAGRDGCPLVEREGAPVAVEETREVPLMGADGESERAGEMEGTSMSLGEEDPDTEDEGRTLLVVMENDGRAVAGVVRVRHVVVVASTVRKDVTDGDTEAVLKGEALTDASVVATALALVVPHGERDALGNADGSPVVLVLVVADTLKGRGGTHARSVALPEAPAPPVDEPLPTNVVTPATTG